MNTIYANARPTDIWAKQNNTWAAVSQLHMHTSSIILFIIIILLIPWIFHIFATLLWRDDFGMQEHVISLISMTF